MAMRKRKRCPFCRCLFWPDGRTAWRQWACSKPECQARRRQETQRRQRKKNRTDRVEREYRAAVSAAKSGEQPVGVPPLRGPLVSLPWDEMRDEIQPEVLVMLPVLGRLLYRVRIRLRPIGPSDDAAFRTGMRPYCNRTGAAKGVPPVPTGSECGGWRVLTRSFC